MGQRMQIFHDELRAFGVRLLNVLKRATSVRAAATAWATGVSAAGQHGGWHEAKPVALWVGIIVLYQICEKLLDDDLQNPVATSTPAQEPSKP